MSHLVRRGILPTLLLVSLVLTSIWVAFDVHDNFNVASGKVNFEWIDGQYVVTSDPNGEQFRPLLSVMGFLNTLGANGTSLVHFFLEHYPTLVGPVMSNLEFPPMDGSFYQNIEAFFGWFADLWVALFNIVWFTISIPVYIFTWIGTAILNVLGFLVTGKTFLDMDAMLLWISQHPIGI